MKKDIDHEFTNEIVCPYCVEEFTDSWEYNSGDEDLGLINCPECGKSFYATRNVEITYTTEKAKYGNCPICGEKNTVLEDYHSSMGSFTKRCLKCGAKEKQVLTKKYIEKIEMMSKEDSNENR